MVAAARAVGVEVLTLHAVLQQVLSCWGVGFEGTCRRDVVGGDRIAQLQQHPGTFDVRDRRRFTLQTLKVGSLAHIGGVLVPGEGRAFGSVQALPAVIAVEDGPVLRGEHLGVDGLGDDLLNFHRVRPDVPQEHIVALRVLAKRVILKVEVHSSGQRVGDHQRRGGQVVHLHIRVDAALKVAVARKHRSHRQILILDCL